MALAALATSLLCARGAAFAEEPSLASSTSPAAPFVMSGDVKAESERE